MKLKGKGMSLPFLRRAPRGARGLKRRMTTPYDVYLCRAPRGARGLKHCHLPLMDCCLVAPRAGRVD